MGRKPIGKRAMTSSERQRRFLDKLRGTGTTGTKSTADTATTRELKARIATLEADLARERAAHKTKTKPANEQPQPAATDAGALREAKARIAELEERNVLLSLELKQLEQKAARKPKAPPLSSLPPDARRDVHIANLKTQIENLKVKLHKVEGYNLTMSLAGGMSFRTMGLIAKVLHPDTRQQATEADLDEACKAFTHWKKLKDRAERRDKAQGQT
jgi:hypothetical protein